MGPWHEAPRLSCRQVDRLFQLLRVAILVPVLRLALNDFETRLAAVNAGQHRGLLQIDVIGLAANQSRVRFRRRQLRSRQRAVVPPHDQLNPLRRPAPTTRKKQPQPPRTAPEDSSRYRIKSRIISGASGVLSWHASIS